MARVEFGERVRRTLRAAYILYLGTEIDLIEADAADGLVLAKPPTAQIYGHKRDEISGGETESGEGPAHLEIYTEDFTFDDASGAEGPYADLDAGRAVSAIPVVLRLTWFSSSGDLTADENETRKDRYAAAVFNVLNKRPDIQGADPAIQSVVPVGVRYSGDLQDAGIWKNRVSVDAIARLEEVQP